MTNEQREKYIQRESPAHRKKISYVHVFYRRMWMNVKIHMREWIKVTNHTPFHANIWWSSQPAIPDFPVYTCGYYILQHWTSTHCYDQRRVSPFLRFTPAFSCLSHAPQVTSDCWFRSFFTTERYSQRWFPFVSFSDSANSFQLWRRYYPRVKETRKWKLHPISCI